MRDLVRRIAIRMAVLGWLVIVCSGLGAAGCQKRPPPLVATVADLKPVHAGVQVSGKDVRRLVRIAVGDRITTDLEGSARVRLDGGAVVIVDRSTELEVTESGFEVHGGRVFVQGINGPKVTAKLGGATALIGRANAGLEVTSEGAAVYCASEELVVQAGDAEHKVQSGETARIASNAVSVEPERAFDDWTGGLAAPWGAQGQPRRAVGALWGRTVDSTDGGSPLTIREHVVEATITGEVAETKVKTTYFNGGSFSLTGDFRMAVPARALVSRFAFSRGDEEPQVGRVLVSGRDAPAMRPDAPALEWAGDGWLRGFLPSLAAGKTVTVEVEYVEWLDPDRGAKGSRVQYRYPLAAESDAPLIGEFSARIDVRPSRPLAVAAGYGAEVKGGQVQLRRSDFRPTADLVVEAELPRLSNQARLYVAPVEEGDEAGDVVLVRTDLPAAVADGSVALAIVVDTSASADPLLFEAARAVVAATLNGLGTRDRVLVMAADQTVRALGVEEMGVVDADRRQAILAALDAVKPGGATDLGRALEVAADQLPADAPSGMVVYVGDGWPTVGDTSLAEIQARLGRRPSGPPRIGAVAIGSLTNRALLAALTRGGGPMLEVADSSEAPAVAVTLMEEALRPTTADVRIVFGPEVERVYPERAQSVLDGHVAWAVGRARGDLPKEIAVEWQDARGPHREVRKLARIQPPNPADVRRRWAAARFEEIALGRQGREAAADVAAGAGLLTPWTSFVVSDDPERKYYQASWLDARVLDLSSRTVAAFATPQTPAGSLVNVPVEMPTEARDSEAAFREAVLASARRIIDSASSSVRACRDSRAALRPELGGKLEVSLALDGRGRASDVAVQGLSPQANDAALNRCVEVVLEGLDYPSSGLTVKVKVTHVIELPAARIQQRRKCSSISSLAMPLRRGVWRERLVKGNAAEEYLRAKWSCELRRWSDKRAFLEMVLQAVSDGAQRVDVANTLEVAGDQDAAKHLRREAVRRARSPGELQRVRDALIGAEHFPLGVFKQRYRRARNDEARLEVVRRFLQLAPHDALLRGRLIALLAALGRKTELVEEVWRVRQDPFADAVLLADCAVALRQIGTPDEARRTFGELTERAPEDPWARAFLGDRLRNEGWYDEAVATYRALDRLVEDEPAGTVRLALAHRGAGRLDLARRMLTRVAESGGRRGDAAFGTLARQLAGVLVAEARQGQLSAEDAARLEGAALELPLRDGMGVVVVRTPAASVPVAVRLVPAKNGQRPERDAEVVAAGIGVQSLHFDPIADLGGELTLSHPAELPPMRRTIARVVALVPVGHDQPPALHAAEIVLPSDGKEVKLTWTRTGWKSSGPRR